MAITSNYECKVILEKLDIYMLMKAEGKSSEVNVVSPMHKNTVLKRPVNTNYSFPKQLLRKSFNSESSDKNVKNVLTKKLPVYKQASANTSQKNDDLYEFDEIDYDEISDSHKNKHNLKKKKARKPKCTQARKRKHKADTTGVTNSKIFKTYTATVQGILQKRIKKLNCNKNIASEKETYECSINKKAKFEDKVPEEDGNVIRHSFPTNEINEYNNVREVNTYKHQKYVTLCEKSFQENDFDFCPSTSLKPNKIINIVSNITLDRSSLLQPDVDNTALPIKTCGSRCTTWRFTANVKRNPHYLYIKKTGLPSLQQDMVLDYNQLRKLEKPSGRTLKKLGNCRTKSSLQNRPFKKLKYFADTSNKENTPNSGLFDNEDSIIDQPNLLQGSLLNKQKPSRKLCVLVPRLQNIIVSTPKNDSKTRIETFFSQDSMEESNIDKLDENLNKDSVKDTTDNCIPKLFEDEEPDHNFSQNYKKYTIKIPKKKRLFHRITEQSNLDNHKKGGMTKTEEAELEQWATKFNSLCNDIENYELEIE